MQIEIPNDKTAAIQQLAANLTAENLTLLADISKKIGINIKIQKKKHLLKLL